MHRIFLSFFLGMTALLAGADTGKTLLFPSDFQKGEFALAENFPGILYFCTAGGPWKSGTLTLELPEAVHRATEQACLKLRNWLGRGEGGRYLQDGAAVRFDAAIGALLAEYWPIRGAERSFLEAELAGYEARPALEGIQLPRLGERVATGGKRTGWLYRMSGGKFRMEWMRKEIQEADFVMRLAGCRHPESLLAVATTAPEGEWYQSLLESVLTNRILIPMVLRLKLYAIEHQGQFPTDLRDLPGGRLPGLRMEKGERDGMVRLYFRCERMNGAPIALELTVGGLTQGENR